MTETKQKTANGEDLLQELWETLSPYILCHSDFIARVIVKCAQCALLSDLRCFSFVFITKRKKQLKSVTSTNSHYLCDFSISGIVAVVSHRAPGKYYI